MFGGFNKHLPCSNVRLHTLHKSVELMYRRSVKSCSEIATVVDLQVDVSEITYDILIRGKQPHFFVLTIKETE